MKRGDEEEGMDPYQSMMKMHAQNTEMPVGAAALVAPWTRQYQPDSSGDEEMSISRYSQDSKLPREYSKQQQQNEIMRKGRNQQVRWTALGCYWLSGSQAGLTQPIAAESSPADL